MLLVGAAALAACGGNDPVADQGNSGAGLPTLNQVEPSPSGTPPEARSNVAEPAAARPGKIPVALRGRWGLSPADCTRQVSDAKGLILVNGDDLRFYESRAVPSAKVQTSANSINGPFDFTGEGRNWSQYEALELQRGKMVRTERNPIATFTYVNCD